MPRPVSPKKRSRKPRYQRTPDSAAALVTCDSESVRSRLQRIESNYVKLDQLLAELESRVPEQESDRGSQTSANPGKPR